MVWFNKDKTINSAALYNSDDEYTSASAEYKNSKLIKKVKFNEASIYYYPNGETIIAMVVFAEQDIGYFFNEDGTLFATAVLDNEGILSDKNTELYFIKFYNPDGTELVANESNNKTLNDMIEKIRNNF